MRRLGVQHVATRVEGRQELHRGCEGIVRRGVGLRKLPLDRLLERRSRRLLDLVDTQVVHFLRICRDVEDAR